jgi:hypothetical protein
MPRLRKSGEWPRHDGELILAVPFSAGCTHVSPVAFPILAPAPDEPLGGRGAFPGGGLNRSNDQCDARNLFIYWLYDRVGGQVFRWFSRRQSLLNTSFFCPLYRRDPFLRVCGPVWACRFSVGFLAGSHC